MGLGIVNVDLKDILSNAGSIFTGFGNFITSVREVITGTKILDPNKAAELEAKALELEGKIREMDQVIQIAQIEVNKIEAGSASKFVAGWRPAAGWLTVLGLAWSTFVVPLWTWIAALAKVPPPPGVDTGILVSLLIGMLGLGAYRTYEKRQDIVDKH
jgi:hypothetical protein